MTYILHTEHDSPNHSGPSHSVPCRNVVLHWWGEPVGQQPDGVIAWLCNPASQVSAHAVVWPGNVAQLLPYTYRSWANGHDWANSNSVTLECDPTHISETIPTIVEYLVDLVADGTLDPNFVLTGHRDWYSTACPGGYYHRLPEIREAVASGGMDDVQLTDQVDTPAGRREVGALLGFMERESLATYIVQALMDWQLDTPAGPRTVAGLLAYSELSTVAAAAGDHARAGVAQAVTAAIRDVPGVTASAEAIQQAVEQGLQAALDRASTALKQGDHA